MVGAVNDGFDAAEALRSARSGGALLHFVEEFSAAFAQPIADGDGVDESELREAEERVGAGVPSALREAYLSFGRSADLTCSQDPLLPPSALRLDVAGTVLVFRNENQSCASWGVGWTPSRTIRRCWWNVVTASGRRFWPGCLWLSSSWCSKRRPWAGSRA
jgi:hypothetical protein